MRTTPPPHRHDVVIVGARAAGAATALLLARAGLDVLVVDQGRYGADTLSTHALMRAGVVLLHRWGLLDAVVAAGTPAVRTMTFRYATDDVTVPIKPAHGVDALYAPRRTVLDPILVDAARAAGATFRYGVTVTDVHRDQNGRVDGIAGRDQRGDRRVAGRWVVGADGIRSRVAAAVDAPIEVQGTGAIAFVVRLLDRARPATGTSGCSGPTPAPASSPPTTGDRACSPGPARPGSAGAASTPSTRSSAPRRPPWPSGWPTRSARPVSAPSAASPGYLRRPYGRGWALVGDAGYWKDPISAHGLTDALRDAELLARALAAAATGAELETEALGEYHATRDRLSMPLFTVTDTIAGLRWTDDEIPRLLYRLSGAMNDEMDGIDRLDQQPALTLGGPA